MKRIVIFISLFIIYISIQISGAYGDIRSEPKDIIIVLDKSLSMEDKISAVKEYTASIVDGLIIDDYFLLLVFYGKTEVAIAKQIQAPEVDIPLIKEQLGTILADGPFTDIGNALDRLKDELFERADNNKKKWCFLVTDGIHEPTRFSKYFSTDGTFKHEFLDDLSEFFSGDGWQVQFLEIGESSSAREIADTLGVDYDQIETDVTAEEITSLIDNPYITISILKDSLKPVKINQHNDGFLQFSVQTEGMQTETRVSISRLMLQSATLTEDNILLGNEYTVLLPEVDGETAIKIPVKVKSELPGGDYPVEILFSFSSTEHFDENGITVTLHKNSIFENHWWIIPLIVIGALLLLGGIALLVSSLIRGKAFMFKLIVDEAPIPEDKNQFKITRNKELYLNESLDVISIVPKKTRKSVARITYTPSGLHFKPLNDIRFEELDEIPQNVINHTLHLRTLSNKLFKITFKSIT